MLHFFISETDAISTSICRKCQKLILKMYPFKLNALAQNEVLKKDMHDGVSEQDSNLIKHNFQPHFKIRLKKHSRNTIHYSITQIYEKYPNVKIPKNCLTRDMIPYVCLNADDVESYMRKKKLGSSEDLESSPHPSDTSLTSGNYKVEGWKKSKHQESPSTLSTIKISPKLALPVADNDRDLSLLQPTLPSSSQLSQTSHVQSENDTTEKQSSCSTKSDFIDSLGLIPFVKKKHRLLECFICGSIYNSIGELREHKHKKHRTREYYKSKLKSSQTKRKHLKVNTKATQILESPCQVILQKIELDPNIKNKYNDAFKHFECFQNPGTLSQTDSAADIKNSEEKLSDGLTPEKSEAKHHNPINAKKLETEKTPLVISQSQSQVAAGNQTNASEGTNKMIIISDDESSENVKKTQNTSTNSSSVIRPNIVIKGNEHILNSLPSTIKDIGLIKTLLELTQQPPPVIDEKSTQTNFINMEEVKLYYQGVCELTNLKSELKHYAIPIDISKGPFQTSYKVLHSNYNKKKIEIWDNFPLIHKPIVKQTGVVGNIIAFNSPKNNAGNVMHISQPQPLPTSSMIQRSTSPKILTQIRPNIVAGATSSHPYARVLPRFAATSPILVPIRSNKPQSPKSKVPTNHSVPNATEQINKNSTVTQKEVDSNTSTATPGGKIYPKLRIKEFWELQ